MDKNSEKVKISIYSPICEYNALKKKVCKALPPKKSIFFLFMTFLGKYFLLCSEIDWTQNREKKQLWKS
jgi:hypothetical protein